MPVWTRWTPSSLERPGLRRGECRVERNHRQGVLHSGEAAGEPEPEVYPAGERYLPGRGCDRPGDDAGGIYRLEAGAERPGLLKRQRKGTLTASLDLAPQESELDSLYEAVADKQIDVERAALSHLAHETLEQALNSLSEKDAKLLVDIYIKGRSAADIAREEGVHRSTVTRRISAILKNLKKFF